MTAGVSSAPVCESCSTKLASMPPVYVCALLSLGKAPEWLALSADRRQAIERGYQIRKDLDRAIFALADSRVADEDPSTTACVAFVTALDNGAGYRASADPKNQVETESTFQMVAIVLVEGCADGESQVDQALTILRMRYPHFPINEESFAGAVNAWTKPGPGGKWPVIAELVGGDPETLRIRFNQWKKTELGAAVWVAGTRG